MKITFVVPALNEESCIRQCLDSIFRELEEKEYRVEVIVVDNGSTDRTAEYVRTFPAALLVNEPKKGLSNARQAGYLAATGDLIANVDADTRLTPGWIDKVLNEFSKNSNLVALSGPFIYYDVSPVIRILARNYYYLAYIVYFLNRFVFNLSSMLQGGNYIIRKSALDKLGGYDLKYDFWGEDADMARRLHPLGKVKFTFRLPIYSSGRRLAEEGILKTGWKYTLNYFGVVIFKKPVTKKYNNIRTKRESGL